MKPTKTTLLFDQPPALDAQVLQPLLQARLERRLTAKPDQTGGVLMRMTAVDLSITITKSQAPITPGEIDKLTNSLVAAPARADLIQTLARSRHHIVVSLMPMPGEGVYLLPRERLTMLELAHGVAAVLVEQSHPDAVIWHHADQALCGAQYEQILQEAAPLALFARARTDEDGLHVEPHSDLLDRPIHIEHGQATPEQAYAAGLAFLHQAIGHGAPLPDADSFGPVCGHEVKITHLTESYELSLTRLPMPRDPNRPPGPNAVALASVQAALRARQTSETDNSIGNLSKFAAFGLPPLGLALLICNMVLGANPFRSAMISLASIALALFTASWMVMSERSTIVSSNAIHVGVHSGQFTD